LRILYLPHAYSQQRQFEKKRWIYPVRLAMEATYYEQKGHTVHWGEAQGRYDKIISKPEGLSFLELPKPNRTLTKAHSTIYQSNGNFKYTPGTYIMSASGCWWGKCRFCVEKEEKWQVREVEDVIEEIKECKRLKYKEVFDDSGTFPIGRWLDEFCSRIQNVGISVSCNMRAVDLDYVKLRKAGFRMLLFGLESANQATLDRIKKGIRCEDVKYIIKAALSGIDCHVAVMFGYPWETDEDAERTLLLVSTLLRKGYAKTAQASFYNPGGTNIGNEKHRPYIKKLYNIGFSPEFWFNQIKSVRNIDDIKYIWKGIKSALM